MTLPSALTSLKAFAPLILVTSIVAISCATRQATLVVIFEAGFRGDSVTAFVNGDTLYNGRLRTNMSISIADERHATLTEGLNQLQFSAPERGVRSDTALFVKDSTFVLVKFAPAGDRPRQFHFEVYDHDPTAGRD